MEASRAADAARRELGWLQETHARTEKDLKDAVTRLELALGDQLFDLADNFFRYFLGPNRLEDNGHAFSPVVIWYDQFLA